MGTPQPEANLCSLHARTPLLPQPTSRHRIVVCARPRQEGGVEDFDWLFNFNPTHLLRLLQIARLVADWAVFRQEGWRLRRAAIYTSESLVGGIRALEAGNHRHCDLPPLTLQAMGYNSADVFIKSNVSLKCSSCDKLQSRTARRCSKNGKDLRYNVYQTCSTIYGQTLVNLEIFNFDGGSSLQVLCRHHHTAGSGAAGQTAMAAGASTMAVSAYADPGEDKTSGTDSAECHLRFLSAAAVDPAPDPNGPTFSSLKRNSSPLAWPRKRSRAAILSSVRLLPRPCRSGRRGAQLAATHRRRLLQR